MSARICLSLAGIAPGDWLMAELLGQRVLAGVISAQAGIDQQPGAHIEQAGHAHQGEGTLVFGMVALATKAFAVVWCVGGAPNHTGHASAGGRHCGCAQRAAVCWNNH